MKKPNIAHLKIVLSSLEPTSELFATLQQAIKNEEEKEEPMYCPICSSDDIHIYDCSPFDHSVNSGIDETATADVVCGFCKGKFRITGDVIWKNPTMKDVMWSKDTINFNYAHKLQAAIYKLETPFVINGWIMSKDIASGCLFFTSEHEEGKTIWLTPMHDGKCVIPVQVNDDDTKEEIEFIPTGDIDKDVERYREAIASYLPPPEQEFDIEITETLQKQVKIKAPDVETAIARVREQYRDSEIELDSDNYVGFEVKQFIQ